MPNPLEGLLAKAHVHFFPPLSTSGGCAASLRTKRRRLRLRLRCEGLPGDACDLSTPSDVGGPCFSPKQARQNRAGPMRRTLHLRVKSNMLGGLSATRGGCDHGNVGAEFSVTLRPQPKGLGRCATSIGGMASYCRRPPPQILRTQAQNDTFPTKDI